MEHGELVLGKGEENMDLPPGFRFHPTDEELITHYLSNKVMDPGFTARAIGEVDLNKCEPWDLPWKAKMGGKQWYFFYVRDRKYPTGSRTNRATEAGYWKATGKDKEIYRGTNLVGMKKTLVFYRGRAPRGEKSNWIMHEYRLEGKCSIHNLPKTSMIEWVISRVFNKSSDGKKAMDFGHELVSSLLRKNKGSRVSDPANVTCFSNAMEGQKGHEELLAEHYNNSFLSAGAATSSEVSPSSVILGKMPMPSTMYATLGTSILGNMQYPATSLVQLLESDGYGMKQSCKTERVMFSNPEIPSSIK